MRFAVRRGLASTFLVLFPTELWAQPLAPGPVPVPAISQSLPAIPPAAQPPPAAPQPPPKPEVILPPRADLTIAPSSVTQLSDLASILQGGQEPLPVNFVFPDTSQVAESHLVRGAGVAQALALRAGNRPLYFSSSRQPMPRRFNVMIGRAEALGFYLPGDIVQQTTGSLLYLQNYPGSGMLPMLIVSGASDAAVDEAILALGLVNQPLPKSNLAYIREVMMPASPPFIRQVPLYPGNSYSFQELESMGSGLQLTRDGGILLDLFMSAMVAAPSQATFQIDLHFLLKQRAFSNLNGLSVLVNGKPVTELVSSDISAAVTGGMAAVISIPINEFLPGRNEVTFQPAGMTGQLATPETFAIFSDSGVVFPRVESPVPLPDLRVTSRTMFPLIGQPDGSEISILVSAKDGATVNSAWTFLAKCAQISNTFLYNASVSFENLNPKLHQMIIGPVAGLPKEYRRGITERWLQNAAQAQKMKLISQRQPEKNLQYFLSGQLQRILPTPTPTPTPEDGRKSLNAQSGYLSSLPNPLTYGRWAVLLCAPDGATLEERTQNLVMPAFWKQLNGTAALWQANPEGMHIFLPLEDAERPLEDRDVQLPFGEKLSRNWWGAMVLAMFLILIILSLALLRNFDREAVERKRRT